MMTLEEIRGLGNDDLKKARDDAREEAFKKRFQSAMESVDNTKLVRELRKRVARIETVIRERELAAAKQSTSAAAPAAASPAGKQ